MCCFYRWWVFVNLHQLSVWLAKNIENICCQTLLTCLYKGEWSHWAAARHHVQVQPAGEPQQPRPEPRHQADPGQAPAGGDEEEQEGGGSPGEPSLLRLPAVLRSPGEQVQE